MSDREEDKTVWLGAVLTAIPHKVTITVQLHVDVLEPLRQKSLCVCVCVTECTNTTQL